MLWISAILMVGLGLRLYHLGAPSFWFDEVGTLHQAGLSLRELVAASVADNHPPLYAFLLGLWLPSEPSETLVRVPSAILGVCSLPLLYRIGALLFSREIGLFASGLLAISPGHIWYSQEARSYSLLVLLTMVSTYSLASALRQDGTRDWVAYTAASVSGVYTHYLSASVLLFQSAFATFYYLKCQIRPSRKLLLALCSIAVLGLPAALHVGHLLRRSPWQLDWVAGQVPEVGLLQLVLLGGQFGLGPYWPPPMAMIIGVPLFTILFVAGIWRLVTPAHTTSRAPLAPPMSGWLCLFWLVIPVLLLLVVSQVKPIWQFRYALVSLPAFLLVVAQGLASIRMRGLKILVTGGLLVASLLSIQKNYREPHKPDWRAVALSIKSEFQNGDLILLDPPASRDQSPLGFYIQRAGTRQDYPILWLSPEQRRDLSATLPRALEPWQRLWLVVYDGPHAEVPGPAHRVLSGRHRRMREQQFYQLRLILYDLRGWAGVATT